MRSFDFQLAQRVGGAGERVDQGRGLRKAHLCPCGVAAVLAVSRELRTVGGAGPVVGAFDVGGERPDAAGEQRLLEFADRAAFMAGRVAQQDQGLLCGVVGPGSELGEPDVLRGFGHGGPIGSGKTGELGGGVEVAVHLLPGVE